MKKKSALLVSISMVLVAVLALTTASFAWFSASMNPSLDGFDVQVTTANALLIGVRKNGENETAIKFKTSLTKDELIAGEMAVGTANQLNQGAKDVLGDVTPKTISNSKVALNGGAIDFLRLTNRESIPDFTLADEAAYNALYTAATNDRAEKDGKIEKDYLQFDVYFKANFSEAANIDVKLDLTSKDTTNAYTGSDFYATKPDETTTEDLTDRIAMTDTDGNGYWITTAMRAGFVATKVLNASGTVDAGTPSSKVLELDGRAPKTLVNSNMDAKKAYTSDHVRKNVTNADGVTSEADTDMALFTMENGCVYKLTVFMWIEGNDKQCVNNISASNFRSIFKFVGSIPTAPAP